MAEFIQQVYDIINNKFQWVNEGQCQGAIRCVMHWDIRHKFYMIESSSYLPRPRRTMGSYWKHLWNKHTEELGIILFFSKENNFSQMNMKNYCRYHEGALDNSSIMVLVNISSEGHVMLPIFSQCLWITANINVRDTVAKLCIEAVAQEKLYIFQLYSASSHMTWKWLTKNFQDVVPNMCFLKFSKWTTLSWLSLRENHPTAHNTKDSLKAIIIKMMAHMNKNYLIQAGSSCQRSKKATPRLKMVLLNNLFVF